MKPLVEERKDYGEMNYRFDTLGRPLDLPKLRVPNFLCLDQPQSRLLWVASTMEELQGGDSEHGGSALHQARQPDARLLDRFIGLVDATPLQLLKFAQRWGPLHICEAHQLPVSHRSDRFRDSPSVGPCHVPSVSQGDFHHHPLGVGRRPPTPRPATWEWYWEPLDRWRVLAGQARAMLNLAATVRGLGATNSADWSALDELGFRRTGGAPLPLTTVAARRAVLAAAVDTWLQWSAIRPKFAWRDTQPHLSYWTQEEHGLFGTLALQLAYAIGAMKGGMLQCSNCHRFFVAQRRPAEGRNVYCPTCGKKAADRDAKRRQRERERAQHNQQA